MGRLSRYKKIKSIDPFAKNGSWKSDVGDCATLRRVRKKSKTAIKMKEQKLNKLQRGRRIRGTEKEMEKKKSGGSNGYGDDDGYDLPPDGEDEFDMNDLLGSVKKQKSKISVDLDFVSARDLPTCKPSDQLSSAVKNNAQSKKQKQKQKNDAKTNNSSKAGIKYDGSQKITHKTSTKDIIAAHSNPNNKKNNNCTNNAADATTTTSNKQEKRKAYLEKKRLKKRSKRNNADDDDSDDDEEYARKRALLQSLHSQSSSSQSDTTTPTTTATQQQNQQQQQSKKDKQHEVKQQNYSNTMIAARSSYLNDQVERPPTFTTLPRGAQKLAKNKKKLQQVKVGGNKDGSSEANGKEEDDSDKAVRIRKEQQALEAMRERVMKQYAVLRESRRSGR